MEIYKAFYLISVFDCNENQDIKKFWQNLFVKFLVKLKALNNL
jgi:hypothetical protein